MSTPENTNGQAITEWLKSIGMERYAAGFIEKGVTPDTLPQLTDDDLKQCGVKMVDRVQIFSAIRDMAAKAAGTMPQAPAGPAFAPARKSAFTIPGISAAPTSPSLAPASPAQPARPRQAVIPPPAATPATAASSIEALQPQHAASHEPPKPTLWQRVTSKRFLFISIAVHVLFALVATVYVVQNIAAKRKLTFTSAPPSQNPSQRALEHKVQMAKKQNTMSAPAQARRITSTGLAKVALPDMPVMSTSTDFTPGKMAGMGGTGVGLGTMGGMGGGGGGGGGIPFFGLRTGGNGIAGTFYDLKQTKDRSPTGFDTHKFVDEVGKFVKGGWNRSTLDKYFTGPQTLYAQQWMIPSIPASEGPAAFQLEKEVKPSLWVVHYKGSVSPTVSGKYHFVGGGDDILMVRFSQRLVFARNWDNPGLGIVPTRWKSIENYEYHYPTPSLSIPNGFGEGEGIDVTAGVSYPIEVLIGEESPPFCFMALLIKKEGETYEKDPSTGLPIFPVFRLTTTPLPPAQNGAVYPPHAPDTSWSVWKVKPASPLFGGMR